MARLLRVTGVMPVAIRRPLVVVNGAIQELAAADKTTVIERFSLTADTVFSDLADTQVAEKTFVATATDYLLFCDVDILVAGPARTIWYLYTGQPVVAGTPLYDVSGAAANGGTAHVIGNVNVDTVGGGKSKTILLEGLTVGDTVTIQALPGIIGAAYTFKCIDGPNSMAVTPDGTKAYVSKYASVSIQPWRLNPFGYDYEYDRPFRAQPGVSLRSGVQPWKFALGNDIGLCGSAGSGIVTIFGISPKETYLRDANLVTGAAFGVTMNPTLAGNAPTTGYASETTGKLYPITISTGVVGTAVQVGAVTDHLYDACLNKAGTVAVCANYTANVVRPVTLPSTLGSTISTVGKPVRIKRPPSMNVTGIASTDVITTPQDHCLAAGDKVVFTDLAGGTGLSNGTNYFVIADGLGPMAFKVSTTLGGAAVNFTTDITAGTVTRNKMWILTEAGGPSSVAMLKSIDLDTLTVTATYNLDYTTGKDFDIMQAGRVAYIGFAAGKFQQMNLEGQFAGSRPAAHSGNLATSTGATFTGNVTGIAIDKLDSIYYCMFEADELFKHPGNRTYVYEDDGFYGSHIDIVAVPVR